MASKTAKTKNDGVLAGLKPLSHFACRWQHATVGPRSHHFFFFVRPYRIGADSRSDVIAERSLGKGAKNAVA